MQLLGGLANNEFRVGGYMDVMLVVQRVSLLSPHREATSSSPNDGILSAGVRRAVIYCLRDGFRGSVRACGFVTPHYHVSRFCEMTQIDFYTPGLMVTMSDSYRGMKNENRSHNTCTGFP